MHSYASMHEVSKTGNIEKQNLNKNDSKLSIHKCILTFDVSFLFFVPLLIVSIYHVVIMITNINFLGNFASILIMQQASSKDSINKM